MAKLMWVASVANWSTLAEAPWLGLASVASQTPPAVLATFRVTVSSPPMAPLHSPCASSAQAGKAVLNATTADSPATNFFMMRPSWKREGPTLAQRRAPRGRMRPIMHWLS